MRGDFFSTTGSGRGGPPYAADPMLMIYPLKFNTSSRTELLDSPVRTEFSTGAFLTVFIWLSMEFSSGHGDQQVRCHRHCDVTAAVTGSPADGGTLVYC